jgi:phosphatidylserine/phosphatidylglycerophosphate/cardiolipin synthase-like enzyme
MRRFVAVSIIAVVLLLLLLGAWYFQHQSVREDGTISVVMCPACKEALNNELRGGGDIVCAIYDIGNETGAILRAQGAQVITDDETNAAYGTPVKHYGLMHNKFCVINDSVVITGSYNPTDGGELNKNNLLIIHSRVLASNYRKEFTAIRTGRPRPSIPHTVWLNGTKVENYFCPNDGCEDHVLSVLATAQHEIVYMTFSFTSDPIGQLLLEKKRAGVTVQGICDDGQINEYAECYRLGSDLWSGPALLHHKVFVVDRQIVITGSYNPTANGDRTNRENVLIIYSPQLAEQYLAEFAFVSS